MKHTLLMQLVGPMQSWGSQSRFTTRDTGLEPTKSGVIGLVCAALGRDRTEDIGDLAALRMGVRVLKEGQVRYDYHTAGRDGFMRADGTVERKDMIVSKRYYLADAQFIVGLEGSDKQHPLLEEINQALRDPFWPLFLGRKSFVPVRPVWISSGVQQLPLCHALRSYKPIDDTQDAPLPKKSQFDPAEGRYVIEYDEEDKETEGIRRFAGPDQPISFDPENRRFALREVIVIHYPSILNEEAINES